MGLLLTLHRDRTVRHVELHPRTAPVIDRRFADLSDQFLHNDLERLEYRPGYKPGPDEIFELRFELPEPLALVKSSVPNQIKPLQRSTFKNTPPVGLAAVRTGKRPQLYLQRLRSPQVIQPEGFLGLFNDSFRLNSEPGIAPTDRLDAIYVSGRLYFRSEQTVRAFFDLSSVFTEASDSQLDEFFGQKAFVVEDMDAVRSAGPQLRRKVAQVMAVLPEIDVPEVKKAARKSKEVSLELTSKGQIVVPADKREFRKLVSLLNDEYVSSLRDESIIYRTNSKYLVR